MTQRPRLPRTPENDLRLIANYCRRIDTILERLTTEEIAALSEDDRWFLMQWAGRTAIDLENAAAVARDPEGNGYMRPPAVRGAR